MILDVKPKRYEVSENIATKVKVNQRMLSTLKNIKLNCIMNPGGKVETSMVGPLDILVALAKRKIVQGLISQGYLLFDPS